MRAVAVRRLVEHACARGPLALLVELRGLPLFVGALLTSLRDSGKLHKYDGRWTLAERHPVAGPVAVTGLLRARIERLCAEGREVLGLIAVCGSRAEHALLPASSPTNVCCLVSPSCPPRVCRTGTWCGSGMGCGIHCSPR
jgi:hypothetical protein